MTVATIFRKYSLPGVYDLKGDIADWVEKWEGIQTGKRVGCHTRLPVPVRWPLEPDDDHATEVYTSSAAAVAALTAMSIAVMTPMATVVVIIMVPVLTTPVLTMPMGGGVVVASIMPGSMSISCPV